MTTKRAMVLGTLLAFIAIGLYAGSASADDASGKLMRGALNTTTGWTELPFQVAAQTAQDPYKGMTYGFMDGLATGLKRTLYGAWDLVTFPMPPYDKPVMDPETLIPTK